MDGCAVVNRQVAGAAMRAARLAAQAWSSGHPSRTGALNRSALPPEISSKRMHSGTGLSAVLAERGAMGLLLVLIGVCAMVGLAALAHADPDDGAGGDDAKFLVALHDADITYASPAQAIGAAKAVCGCLNDGESGLELVHDVETRNPGFDMDDAAEFAVISAKYYCPQQLTKR
ncbi:hypothetical protein MSIMFI_00299 [Mycobacterium simulans]|nr:hypothetical protein MSIMFI_00299 [Mycobacterium simulans]